MDGKALLRLLVSLLCLLGLLTPLQAANTGQADSQSPGHMASLQDGGQLLSGWTTARDKDAPGTRKPGFTQAVDILMYLFLVLLVVMIFLKLQANRQREKLSAAFTGTQTVLGSLSDGVLLLDRKGKVIFSNNAFTDITETEKELLNKQDVSALPWVTSGDDRTHPWVESLETGKTVTEKHLQIIDRKGITKTLLVNSSRVVDTRGKVSGVIATFDDVTNLEKKNDQLQEMLGMLNRARDEIRRQNEELQYFATRDPLTNCLNRRSFFDKYESVFQAAQAHGHPLACIISDVDLFKSVNDRYGYATGDKVIQSIAGILGSSLRSQDTICRFGGEEFCIILPGISADNALKMAERARSNIASNKFALAVKEQPLTISSSFGLSSIDHGAATLQLLVNQADQALLESKNNGRNRVTAWNPLLAGTGNDDNVALSKADGGTPCAAGDNTSCTLDTPQSPLAGASDRLDLNELPGRRAFQENIMHAIAACQDTGRYLTVITLGIDTLARLRKEYGRTAGNDLLNAMCKRIQAIMRSSEQDYRQGSDKPFLYHLDDDDYGVLLSGLECTEFTEQLVQRIINAATEPFFPGDYDIQPGCNVGVSHYPVHGSDSDSLMNHADVALYHARRLGDNCYQIYNTGLATTVTDSASLETELQLALERDELELYYQPKINLVTGKIISMEVLLRWQHPEHGMVPPGELLALAEESGLILPLGEWILKTACLQVTRWRELGYSDLAVSVNLSSCQFRDRHLPGKIDRVLRETGTVSGALELEVTEKTIMENFEASYSTMRALHRAGIRISVDDFGTGYLSLTQLKRFPISCIKIDHSFIRDLIIDPDDAAIVNAIIAMARNMGLNVTAKGVENDEQRAYLASKGCNEIQGFLLSQPVACHEAEVLLAENRPEVSNNITNTAS